VSILICTSSSENVTIVILFIKWRACKKNVLECCINIILWEAKGLSAEDQSLLAYSSVMNSRETLYQFDQTLSYRAAKTLLWSILVVGSSAQNGKFLNFRKDQHRRHNRQSCRLRTLARWMARKNRTYHQTNPAYKALAAGNRLSVTLSKPLRSRNNAVLFKTKIIHRLVYDFFNLLPIWASLNEFVHVLYIYPIFNWLNWVCGKKGGREGWLTSGRYAPPYRVTSLTIWARSLASSTTKTWPSILRCEKSAVIAGTYVVGLGIGKRWGKKRTDLEGRDKGVVGVQVGYDLESPVEGYNLSLDVFLQDPGYSLTLNNVT